MEMATGFYPVKIGVRVPAGVPFGGSGVMVGTGDCGSPSASSILVFHPIVYKFLRELIFDFL